MPSIIFYTSSYITLDNQWFFACGNLSEYNVEGYEACSIYKEDTFSLQLKHERKTIYLGIQRFLPTLYHYRRLQKAFNGSTEEEKAPKELNGKKVYEGWNISCQVVKKWSKIQLKRLCERSNQYYLISCIWSVSLWDIALMSCIFKKMCVIALLAHYSIYPV